MTLEIGGSSAEGSGGVTAVGEIVKGSGGQIGSDLVVSGRVRPTEDSRRLDLSVHQLEMPVFKGWNPEEWIYRAERYFCLNKLS